MLTPDDQRRAEALFELMLELPPADREDFLVRECRGRPDLAREVRLLQAHYDAAPADFLQSPAGDRTAQETLASIGPYELQEVLGEGGMGVVYRAQQTQPVVRTVALKILKLGLNSREILARFEAERQALAQLEHPNIARVYDAGTTPDGRPYFVMEYVQGPSITAYCDAKRLTPRRRIELFIALCRGVQHAHQQGIIHRDLKPTNILVAEQDGIAQPKVIDFGVAKAVQKGLPDDTLFTQLGQLVGTPEYMSPEQAEAAPVDTRTDVYSLGAVLYELLVGALPIDGKALREAGAQAMMRLIREQDPQRPSARASTLDASSTTVAACRSVAPRVLARTLRGELDWIALKALAKDRERRYATVAEFAADLQRHLAHEPVTARPAGAWYVLGKFARRHRLAVGVALTLGLAIAVFGVGSAIQARRVARERDRANHEAEVARQVKDFLVDIFQVSDPGEARGRAVTAREILDTAAQRVSALDDGAVRAELTGVLGAVYQNLGLYATSDSLFIAAKDLWLATRGLDDPATLAALSDAASVFKALGRHAEAESLSHVALAGWERLGLAGDRRALLAMNLLANNLRGQRRFAEAESLLEHTLASWLLLAGEDDPEVLRVRGDLAYCYFRAGKHAAAEPIATDVLARWRRLAGNDSPRTLAAILVLADLRRAQGRLDEAGALLLEAHATRERVLGTEHPAYVAGLESLAGLYYEKEDHARALAYFREVLAARSRIFGPAHRSTVVAMHNLAAVLSQLGELAEAETVADRTLALRLADQGEDHPYTQQTRQMLAVILVQRGDLDGALAHLRIAVAHGFDFPILLSDETLATLAPLRVYPEFEDLLDVVRQRIANKVE